jgi:hypothetical protein
MEQNMASPLFSNVQRGQFTTSSALRICTPNMPKAPEKPSIIDTGIDDEDNDELQPPSFATLLSLNSALLWMLLLGAMTMGRRSTGFKSASRSMPPPVCACCACDLLLLSLNSNVAPNGSSMLNGAVREGNVGNSESTPGADAGGIV